MKHKFFLITVIFTCMVSMQMQAQQKKVSGDVYIDYYSPKNKSLPYRSSTRNIVLHMTEAGDKSSLNSVHKNGACNYLVATNGTVYRIVDKKKVANHAGRSMWNGRTNVSEFSIGIEIVGFHDTPPTQQQLHALKNLIAQLQAIYRLTDKDVVAHCMVAYGVPHKWVSYNHRGRKRCGMLLTTKPIRQKMGLDNVFTVDPDVASGKLKNADLVLAKLIYGGGEVPVKPIKGITEPESVSDDEEAFDGFREINGGGAWGLAGNQYNKSTTIYFFPTGTIRRGDELTEFELFHLPKGMKVLVGYVYGGKISKDRSAYSVVGKKWNLPSTFYRLPDQTIKSGVEIDTFPEGTIIIFRK